METPCDKKRRKSGSQWIESSYCRLYPNGTASRAKFLLCECFKELFFIQFQFVSPRWTSFPLMHSEIQSKSIRHQSRINLLTMNAFMFVISIDIRRKWEKLAGEHSSNIHKTFLTMLSAKSCKRWQWSDA